MRVHALFSPAMILSLSIVGLYSLSGYINVLTPTSSAGNIFARAFLLCITVLVFIQNITKIRLRRMLLLLPVFLFFTIYSFRLIENILLSRVYVTPEANAILIVFFVNCIFSSVVVALLTPLARDSDLFISMRLLCVLFLIGMAANYGTLVGTLEARVALAKINPISMGHTAFSFAIFFLVVLVLTGRGGVATMVFLPVLTFLIVYARSRGAYVAGGMALAALLLARARSRRTLIVAVALVAAAALNTELINEVVDRLLATDPYRDLSTFLRILALKGAWEQFVNDPFFGRYVFERVTNLYPHNIYVEALMSVGLVGATPFFLHVIIALRGAFGLLLRRGTPVVAVFTALIFMREVVASMFSGALYGNSVFWTTSIATIVLWVNRERLADSRRTVNTKSLDTQLRPARSSSTGLSHRGG